MINYVFNLILNEVHSKLYFKKIMWAMKQYGPIMKAQKSNPELAAVLAGELELKGSRNDLLKQLKGATDDDKDDIVAELRRVVSERFDLMGV